ncbi:MAG TPA: hypothetical protein VHV77_01185, partial [Pirellulales bacterium]|nr:hypothetical protein [Pirellulales bacterium]
MRRLGWMTALVGLGLSLTPSIGQSAEYGMQSVALVIDCSNSMGEAAAGAPGALAADESRMDMTLDVVKSTLTRLAEKGDHRVAIWLYGHRLAWNGSADAPDLQEQTNYLEQTLGFNVLSDLLPGDDVELVRPLT